MIEIVPAIDIIGGKCVRLTRGDYSKVTSYGGDPVEVAKSLAGAGCRRLHLVDLDGAKARHIVNHATLERVASVDGLTVDFGGGVKTDDDFRIAIDSGAAMVTGGSVAVTDPALFQSWIARWGADVVILGADARDRRVATVGWERSSDIDVVDFIADYHLKGVKRVISTDISVDGTLQGPSIDLYRDILDRVDGVTLIASGGVSSIDDIEALGAIGVPEVIVGKAIFEGRVSLSQLERHNSKR